nr:MAG: replication associated protein [Cressdnaviricota sp.]
MATSATATQAVPPKPPVQSKTWMFTVNNYTPEDEERIQQWDCQYVRYGREVGEQGTPHLQGIMQTFQKITLAGLKLYFHKTCHWGDKHGQPVLFATAANNYCAKDGDVWEKGTFITRGQRTDIQHMVRMVKDGKRKIDTAEQCAETMVKYPHGYKLMREIYDKPRVPDGTLPFIHFFIGTNRPAVYAELFKQYPDAYWITPEGAGGSHIWFDRYDDEDTLVFAEGFDYSLNFERICEIAPFKVQSKGGSRELKARKFVFVVDDDDGMRRFMLDGKLNFEPQYTGKITRIL